MKITVKMFANLTDFLPPEAGGENAFEMEMKDGALAGDVVERLPIPDNLRITMLLNGVHAKPDKELKDGDVLALFPLIAGG